MTSSMLSGDRRWTSGRRGMTVLGKVAVPKPINLRSQRLENHGLDPNVEIVPKGSLSWGSKSSSSSNAWGSSTLSPKTDGGSVSPSLLSARPSSGGSGTRPSTAGSERGQETSSAWCSSSRPSSASGALTSNQSPITSLRPCSAETRPGSSQLSRFAEPAIDSTIAWTAGGAAEKLGVVSSKNDGFSLASGDFPTLGSEKDASGRTTDPSSHSCPGSSSGAAAAMNERIGTSVAGDISINANIKSGALNSWRRENFPHGEDGIQASVERWHAQHQGPYPYSHPGIPPQHYDAWQAPPINNHPSGLWYRGPPGGPPYGSPVPPRAFPLEPFPPYYQPQIPGNALPNPPPVPPPGAGPRGHHPKNEDMYRPIPDGYVHPVMPIRHSFYPGPVGYDSYYGPPMGYCNSSERDVQIMGVAAGPPPYNRHSSQNVLDSGGSNARPSEHGPPNKMASEQVESVQPHDEQRPYKVLLKQHEGRDGKEQHKWDSTVATGAAKDDQSRLSPWGTDWKADQEKEKKMNLTMVGEETSYQNVDSRGGGFVFAKFKSSEGMQNMKGPDDTSGQSAECPPASFPEVLIKDVTLIQKIEGLNAKARASEGQYEETSTCSRNDQKNIPSCPVTEAAPGSGVGYPDKLTAYSGTIEPTSVEVGASVGDKSGNVTAAGGEAFTRRSTHGIHGITDNRGRGRFGGQEVDGWQKRQQVSDAPNIKSAAHAETGFKVDRQDCTSSEFVEQTESYSQLKDKGELAPFVLGPNDSQAQRAMMRELAKQRVKQRQKEEEERAKDQKAKALAKLEELNRRTSVENQCQKLGVTDVTWGKLEELQTPTEETKLANKSESSNVDVHGGASTNVVENPELSSNVHTDTISRNAHAEISEARERSQAIQKNRNNAEAGPINTVRQAHDGISLKQKRMVYISLDECSIEKTISNSMIESQKTHSGFVVDVDPSAEISSEIPSGSESSITQNIMIDPPVHQRRKTNRIGKNKHRVDEASTTAVLSDGMHKEANPVKTSVEGQQASPEVAVDRSSVQSLTESKDAESHARVNNLWKNQHHRRMPRNQQSHRSAEKFHSSDSVMWAPVRSISKADAVEEVSQKKVAEVVAVTVKNDIQVQNNPRNKRAEMERYVPKPVAKEIAQQGTVQSLLPGADQSKAIEDVWRAAAGSQLAESEVAGSTMEKVGIPRESRSSDGRPNQQGKGHRSWRQRTSTESAVQNLQDMNSSESSQKTQRSLEHHESQKPDINPGKEQTKYDKCTSIDGWGFPENIDSAVAQSASNVRDQGLVGQGKRHTFKGNKGMGNHDLDIKKTNSESVKNVEISISEMSQASLPSALKENRNFSDGSTSHWQLKSSNQWGRADGDQSGGMESYRSNKKGSSHGKRSHPSNVEKESSEGIPQTFKDQSINEKRNVEEATIRPYQHLNKEGKTASQKGRAHSPSHGVTVECSSVKMDNRDEQHSSSGFRKNGNQNSRLARGHQSRGAWGSSGPDMKHTVNWEKQRQNSHYEYQPVGSRNNSREHILEGQKDVYHNAGARFGDRGPNQSRHGRGNFYGHQSGAATRDVVMTGSEES